MAPGDDLDAADADDDDEYLSEQVSWPVSLLLFSAHCDKLIQNKQLDIKL